jgi:hypothetical protein
MAQSYRPQGATGRCQHQSIVEILFHTNQKNGDTMKYYCNMLVYLTAPIFFLAGFLLGRNVNRPSEGGGALPELDLDLNESREAQFGHLKDVLQALHDCQGQEVDTQRMDEMLALEDVSSAETKRSRRSRIVSDLNAWGWAEFKRPILVREKDEGDRRRTLYKVAEFDLPAWMK